MCPHRPWIDLPCLSGDSFNALEPCTRRTFVHTGESKEPMESQYILYYSKLLLVF